MAQPGEVTHDLGKAYLYAFTGALEATIRPFTRRAHVYEAPEKLTFKGRNGAPFSFDFFGDYASTTQYAEVFGESKGYSKAGNLLAEYRSFLAKAYVTSVDNLRHRKDLFWFVSNVPFGCSEGKTLLSEDYIYQALTEQSEKIQEVVGNGVIDRSIVRELAPRLSIFVLTDSFLKKTDILYFVSPGETLWSIVKLLHGNEIPGTRFEPLAHEFANLNNLESPDKIKHGTRIRLSWKGIPR